jgi:hypothetical protein
MVGGDAAHGASMHGLQRRQEVVGQQRIHLRVFDAVANQFDQRGQRAGVPGPLLALR